MVGIGDVLIVATKQENLNWNNALIDDNFGKNGYKMIQHIFPPTRILKLAPSTMS